MAYKFFHKIFIKTVIGMLKYKCGELENLHEPGMQLKKSNKGTF